MFRRSKRVDQGDSDYKKLAWTKMIAFSYSKSKGLKFDSRIDSLILINQPIIIELESSIYKISAPVYDHKLIHLARQ
jgi:hypothetical protein